MGRRRGASGILSHGFRVSIRSFWTAFVLLCFLLAISARPASGQASANPLLWPSAIAYDAAGNLYIADSGRHQVFEATLAGRLLVVAGVGTQGFTGDGGPAKAAQLDRPQGIAVGTDGTIYIADTGNARIRAVAGGIISTLAGTGKHVFGGDGGPAVNASFRNPSALALDGNGGLLLCDSADHRIRRVNLQTGGLVSTVAGTGVQGYTGDGGTAITAELDSPQGVAVASDGRLFIADTHNQRVRVVTIAGTITSVAGSGTHGSSGDGGLAVSAQLADPRGLALAADGTVWIGDGDNRRVRQVSTTGVITTLAGTGVEGSGSDGDTLADTLFRTPRAMAASSFGQPVVADTLNGTVRVLTVASTVFQPAALAPGRSASQVVPSLASTQVYGLLSASVSVTGPVATPQGTVILAEGGNTLASAALHDGTATLGGGFASAGSHVLQMAYSGDGLNAAASGSPFTLTVTPLAITAVANSASMVYGTPTPALTGSLQGVLSPDVGQVTAGFSVPAGALAPVGTYPISATLTGSKSSDYVVGLGANSGSLQVTPAPSVTSLAQTAAGYAGLPLRLTANVASTTYGQPTGTVQFLDGGSAVATGTVVNGSASGVEVAPASGTHNLAVVYSGDGNFLPSSSAIQVATVDTLPDFAISLGGASSTTVLAGSGATYHILVSAAPAPFTGDVTLAVSGLPQGATAAFTPVQVVPGTAAASVTLTVLTPAAQARIPVKQPAVWFGCVALVALTGCRRKRRLNNAFLVAVCFALALCSNLAGCGARTVGEGTSGLTSKTYSLTVTGTSTNLLGAVVTHDTGATLIVQQ